MLPSTLDRAVRGIAPEGRARRPDLRGRAACRTLRSPGGLRESRPMGNRFLVRIDQGAYVRRERQLLVESAAPEAAGHREAAAPGRGALARYSDVRHGVSLLFTDGARSYRLAGEVSTGRVAHVPPDPLPDAVGSPGARRPSPHDAWAATPAPVSTDAGAYSRSQANQIAVPAIPMAPSAATHQNRLSGGGPESKSMIVRPLPASAR